MNKIVIILILLLPIYISNGAAQEVITLYGQLHVLWGDSIYGKHSYVVIFITNDDILQLEFLNNNYNIYELDGKYATISGQFRDDGVFIVTTINLIETFNVSTYKPVIVGEQAWVTILARFEDVNSTPEEPAYFNNLLYSSIPASLNSYWKQTSYDNITIIGTSYGWYNLTKPKSYYTGDPDPLCGLTPRFDLLLNDMIDIADSDVNFTNYDGINLVYNELIGTCVWGGSAVQNIDGVNKQYRVTWVAPPALKHSFFAHEMGHGFGLHHSSGPYNTPYDSEWDVMSNANNCRNSDIVYGCIAVSTISYHKYKLGWIPDSKIYTASNGTKTIKLYPLNNITSGYVMIKIPIDDDRFYTVEYRRQMDYDLGIPSNAVLIHKVDENLPDRQAQVVDIDNDFDPNDEGAIWRVGEVFIDESNNIKVSVIDNQTTYAKVNISINRSLANFTSLYIQNGILDALFVLGDSKPHGPKDWGAMVNDVLGAIGIGTMLGQLSNNGSSTQVLDTNITNYNKTNDTISIEFNKINSNIISVGGPAVNLVTYYYDKNKELPFFLEWINDKPYIHSSVTNINYTFSDNEDYAIIGLVNDNGKDILLVWGLTHNGTQAASQLLQYYNSIYTNMLDGTAMLIKWNDNGNGIVDITDPLTIVESY
ncbi:MAG: hypothetical protein KatS3mg003_1917 [Candidatus Nitrosocaldaceae archaeon]|nr:MAG: hypothetical protein KatS3mg003_1917 [Candidatus Nitrosocaldaceae archaeon]